MGLPTRNDVTLVDPVLTNLSLGYKNERFLWDKIAPSSGQKTHTGTYPIYTRDYWFTRPTGVERAATGPYTRIGYGVGSGTYSTNEIGFEHPVGDVTKNSSQLPEDLELTGTNFLTHKMQIELEKRVAAACFITGVWGTSTTLTGTDQWSDYDNSDPIANANTAKDAIRRATGTKPNTLFIGETGWQKLKEHPDIINKYKYSSAGTMTTDLVAAVLEIDEIVVGDSIENTAAEGQTFAGADIWTDNGLFLVRNQPALGVANGAYTFMWDEIGNIPWAMQRYNEDQTRALILRILTHVDVKIISTVHGYMYLDLVA